VNFAFPKLRGQGSGGLDTPCYHPRTLPALITLGIVFLVIGISRPSGAFIGLGAAFLAIALARKRRRRV
jgi:hypothetical protein